MLEDPKVLATVISAAVALLISGASGIYVILKARKEIELIQRKIIAENHAKRFSFEAQQYRDQYNSYLNTKRKIDAENERAGAKADGTRLAQHILDFYGVSRDFYRENKPLLQSL